MITYEPFWKSLKKKGISQYKLINEYGFSTGTLDSLRKNRPINTSTLNDICRMLNLKVQDVIRYEEEKQAIK